MNTRVENWYDSQKDFDEVLEAAEENAMNHTETLFVDELRQTVDQYGMRAFLSESQNTWLRDIAQVSNPHR